MSDTPPTPERSFGWRHIVGLVALLALVGGATYVIANEQGSDDVVVRMGEAELTEDELITSLQSSDPLIENDTFTTAEAAQFISNWMIMKAVELEFVDLDITVSQESLDQSEVALTAQGIDSSTASGAFRIHFEAVGATLVNYADSIAEFDTVPPEFLCASHLLVDTEEEAVAALARIEGGEDFGDVAAEVSTEPGAEVSRGDLGCNDSGAFVVEFTEGARTSGGSGVVGPVETSFGFHIIDVRSVGPLTAQNHPEMSEAAVAAGLGSVEADARSAASGEIFNEIVSAAQLRIEDDGFIDARYGIWDPASGVVPPDGVSR